MIQPGDQSFHLFWPLSGYYKTYYSSLNNVSHNHYGAEALGVYGTTERGDSDKFFMNRLNLDVSFRPTDEITVLPPGTRL